MKRIQSSSERGIALVVVLLLMAVLSGLATGFAMTGNVEVQMGTNEVHFAGARAAAEAGLNRAIVEIVADNTTNFLAGQDTAFDNINLAAAVNADNGNIGFLIGSAGPYALGTSGQYSYAVEILDDDNPLLHDSPLTPTQLAQISEDGFPYTNGNEILVLRATGFGPNGTTVRLARVIESTATPNSATTPTSVLSNPAILVNGDLEMNGSITVQGTSGSVHTNGNLSKTGTGGTITVNATASGTWSQEGNFEPGGAKGGGRPTINVPNIQASDYISLADYKLTSSGAVQTLSGGVWTNCTTTACKNTGWSHSGGIWNLGKNPGTGTYYVEGDVDIGPTQGGSNNAVSVISTGSINVHGQAKLTPENPQKIQFVADGDVEIVNGASLDDPTNVEGQIMVRGQFEAGGNMTFQGRVMVQDVQSVGNLVENGTNRIHGSVRFTYNGTLGAIETVVPVTTNWTTYVNNVSGWMEQ